MRVTGAFLVYDEKRNRKVLIADIVHCEASVNITIIHLRTKTVICTRTLKKVESLISGLGFIRIHRKHLVNSAFIQSISPDYETLILSNGKTLEVSRRKKQSLS